MFGISNEPPKQNILWGFIAARLASTMSDKFVRFLG